MELSEWCCPDYDEWFLGDDAEMWHWNDDADVIFGPVDQEFLREDDIETRQERKIFRPFLSLTTVESVVPAMNAVVNKRTMM